MDKITDLQLFNKRYTECLEKEEGWCYVCIPEVTMKMNEKYNEQYTEEQVSAWLFGDILVEDTFIQFENLGINL
jgi:hypothetical protein